jgi:hypothetical protein
VRAARAALQGAGAALVGITLGELAIRQELLAPWWLYLLLAPAAALTLYVYYATRVRGSGRHRA